MSYLFCTPGSSSGDSCARNETKLFSLRSSYKYKKSILLNEGGYRDGKL